jgi:hypothetical protein
LAASCGSVATLPDANQIDCTDPNPCTVDSPDGAGGCTHVAGNAGATCRAAAGDCDVAETCTGSDVECPADELADATVECRASTGTCDPAETCAGDSADCPTDVTFPYRLYAATGSSTAGELYTIDKATGASTDVGPIGFSVTGLAMQPGTRTLYAVTGCRSPVAPAQLATIDPATGSGVALGTLGAALGSSCNAKVIADIAFDSGGTLYGWMEISGDNVYDDLGRIDLTTFVATAIADSALGTSGSALAFDATDRLFYAGEGNPGPLRQFDTTTGLPTTVATLSGGPAGKFNAFALDPATGTIYGNIQGGGGAAAKAAGPGSGTGTGGGGGNGHGGGRRALGATSTLVTLDTTTGAISTIGPMPTDIDALAFACEAP